MVKADYIFEDNELGCINVRVNSRARRFTFRGSAEGLVCTAPASYTLSQLRQAVEQLRPRLLALKDRALVRNIGRRFTPDMRIDTPDYHFWLEPARVTSVTLRQRQGQLVCYYPAGISWDDEVLQHRLLLAVEKSLAMHAKVLFPPRLQAMAAARGLRYNQVCIRKAKGRWGSCSSAGNISLNAYLMVIPRHLQDYVMQHELTHLIEMNHSPRFWALLDEAVGGKARQYAQEMKNFDTTVF